MKKSLLVGVIVTAIAGCAPQNKFVIRGTIPSDGATSIMLIGAQSNDTIAHAKTTNGRFLLQGTVRGITPAFLSCNAVPGSALMLIEPARYQITVPANDIGRSHVRSSSEAQRVASEYANAGEQAAHFIDSVRQEFLSLKRNTPRFDSLLRQVDAANATIESERRRVLEENSTSYLALFMLTETANRMPLEDLKSLFAKYPDTMKQSTLGQQIQQKISARENTVTGHVAPDFELQSPEGETFRMHQIGGRLKLIDFWASWCRPCRALVPLLKSLYEQYRPLGFEIVGVSMDDKPELWKKALREENMTWKNGSNLKGFSKEAELSRLYSISGIPHLVLVDSENRILGTYTNGGELKEAIEAFFKK